ncbi:MAG: imidazolonepropionase [Rikenellaceae bacterium]
MKTLIKNIKKLVQVEEDDPVLMRSGAGMSVLNCIDNAYLITEDDKILDFGEMTHLDDIFQGSSLKTIDANGKMVLPAFCDSHTHLVYAGSREMEFFDKQKGLSYQEIAKRGGGILNSALLLHETSEDDLYRESMVRVDEITGFGTGAVEIKSGYGLTLEDEIKMLRVIRRISDTTPLTVKATFLGAHAVPLSFKGKQEEYVDDIISVMIPVIAAEELADYVDVFCEDGFFTVEDTDRIFNAAMKYGLRPKIHANQMGFSGGVQVGVKYNAISADHLEFTGEKEFEALKGSETIATLLPGATFFLGMDYAPARDMITRGLPIAIASNYNPGSCPSGDMKFMMALSALKLKLTPQEIINAVTINGAYAMGLSESHGSIARGKQANILITKEIPSLEYLLYAFNSPLIETVILKGNIVR